MRPSPVKPHSYSVNNSGPAIIAGRSGRLVQFIRHLIQTAIYLLAILTLLAAGPAQVAERSSAPHSSAGVSARHSLSFQSAVTPSLNLSDETVYQPVAGELPQDQGTAGLRQMLLRLSTSARMMQVVAHPDDEDGGMLTLESRGRGASVLLMTLNRGEGGQNKIGSNLSDVLGVLRALELLASDQYYGVQERFSRVADFGFSKNPEETFQKWGGHDAALADVVRVVRTFRPDVLVARFSGTERDGHGHHQASAILTKEAFRAAADPKRFPEQIAQGLSPWQAKKLYVGNVCGFGASSCPDANWTVKLNTGEPSVALGMSYVQFAMQGLRRQLSQGAAGWTVEPGDRFTFYKLVDSVDRPTAGHEASHEKDFFDGIDRTLPGLATRLGAEESKLPRLRGELTTFTNKIAEASTAAGGNEPASAAEPLFAVSAGLDRSIEEVRKSNLSEAAKVDLLTRLAEKRYQAKRALNLAMNISMEADVAPPGRSDLDIPKESGALTAVSPGESFLVTVKLHNGSKHSLAIDAVKLQVPDGWTTATYDGKHVSVQAGADFRATFQLQAPKDAAYTRPYWHRDDPDRESVNHIDDEKYATLPFPPPPLRARVEYSVVDGKSPRRRSALSAIVATAFLDDKGAQRTQPLAIVPAFSVMLEPGTQVISTHNGSTSTVTVGISTNVTHAVHGTLRLELPEGWKSEPSERAVELTGRGDRKDFEFRIVPAGLQEGRATIRAVLDSEGEKYSEGYTLVARDDLGSFHYYQPAVQNVSIVNVEAPHDLRIGYIMGAGDNIPTVLKQIGMDVMPIPAEKLGSEDLSRYATIVLGIRAYDTQKEVAQNNKRLLDYVSAGGTLLVQYNTGPADFNSGHFTPYPAQLSRARVSVEEAPVDILALDDSVFHYPNTISAHDFDGWVQERGLYFMDQWDDHFKPLLASHDPGENPQKGGLLRAQYGKGTYIYTGYAFFRQLPAGVPGAVRLYVNLLSAGHEK